MGRYLLSLDQGTTSSRAIVFNENQHLIAMSQKEFPQIYPEAGWVEHNPMDIYGSQREVMLDAVHKAGIRPQEIAAIGITNQRETTVVWDRKTGSPVCNAIAWQCRRTAGMVDMLVRQEGMADYIHETTGLIPDAYFSATKIRWILDHVEGVRERAEKGDVLFGTVDSWLLWKLTGGKVHATDVTNASRTMLFNIHTLDWDQKLLDTLEIPRAMLPEVRTSSEIYGYTEIDGAQIPIAGIAGDQQSALFGQCCFHPGDTKCTYGTGCFLLRNTGTVPCRSKNLITTIAVGLGGKVQYALEGSVFVGGAVIQWLRDELKFLSDSSETGRIAAKLPDNGGVYLVPAFTGLGAPYWDMYARGCLIGLTRGTGRDHIVRAAEESIAYQTYDLVSTMEKESGTALGELKADGGASRDNFLMQFQADLLNLPVKRPVIQETTALGAAYLAGLAVGIWSSTEEISRLWSCERVFEPSMPENKRDELLRGWHRAVERSRGWIEP